MYVVINVGPNDDLSSLMKTLADRRPIMAFSVTDSLEKLCNSTCSSIKKHDASCQTVMLTTPTPTPSISQSSLFTSPHCLSTKSDSNDTPSISELEKLINNPSRNGKMGNPIDFSNREQEDEEPTQEIDFGDICSSLIDMANKSANINQMSNKQELNMDDSETATWNMFDDDNINTMTDGDSRIGQDYLLSELLPTSNKRTKKDPRTGHRGLCHYCNRTVSTRSHHMRRHAIRHLGLKKWKCHLCSKFFSRPDIAKPHFDKHHPGDIYVPFTNQMTLNEGQQLLSMVMTCFPDEQYDKIMK